MSHVVEIKTEVRDPAAIRSACSRLKLALPVFGETKLFSRKATGWAVQLPEWRYPIVCDVVTAKVAYDNYEERWGKKKELDCFLQGYAVEKTKIEARRAGYAVTEQPLEDGSIKVTINAAGGES
jgi:hypothetical protein